MILKVFLQGYLAIYTGIERPFDRPYSTDYHRGIQIAQYTQLQSGNSTTTMAKQVINKTDKTFWFL
jgi:hypothetical protein